MKAVNNYIIIDPIKNEPKKVGGLILTDEVNEDNRYLKAKVVSVGHDVVGIKENDVINTQATVYNIKINFTAL